MARHEERHDLVANLLVRRAEAGFGVARGEQHRERVGAIGRVVAPARDQRVDDLVELRARAPKPARVRKRQAAPQRTQRREHVREFAHHQAQRVSDETRPLALVAAEEGLRRDAQRELNHRCMRVEDFAGRQTIRELARVALHDPHVLRDPLPVKRGLDDAPHLQVHRILARQ